MLLASIIFPTNVFAFIAPVASLFPDIVPVAILASVTAPSFNAAVTTLPVSYTHLRAHET